jgi:hypothetical protein
MPSESDGADLVLHEILDEASNLVHHPLDEIKRLTHVAADGDSPTTPLLVSLGVTLLIAGVGAVVLAAALLVYYLG